VDDFFNGPPKPAEGTDLRARFSGGESSGRVEQWDIALDAFSGEPLRGHGAGTYEQLWNAERSTDERMIDAHSLYLEVLAELGIVGLLLVVVALGGIVVAFAQGLRGDEGALRAALVAAAVIWLLHAAGDWDWETPSTGVWLFALGGAAAARSVLGGPREDRASAGARWPVVVALAWVAIAVGPLVVMLSEGRLTAAQVALADGDCVVAADEALSSIDMLSTRREPFEVIGFCRATQGFPRQGRDAMLKAVERDPGNWEARYALAVVRAQAGEDPSADLAVARRMSPLEPLVISFSRSLREAPRTSWPEIGAAAQFEALDSGRLTVADQ
jgi:hypothetical protein